ncbi:MAG TPA: hypothetical protein VFA65_04985 [Bryobacteraceae bacterium]|nr:hypothetical protein [Bryobacteraceae bacterium]
MFTSHSDGGIDQDDQLWSFDLVSGQERQIGKTREKPEHSERLLSPDRSKIAVANGEYVLIEDAVTEKELWRANLNQPTASGFKGPVAFPLAWTANGKRLLLGAVGENTSSSSPQSDFFVLDLTTRKLRSAGTGNSAYWIPGRDAILYSTPRYLCPLAESKHQVWCAHLAVFDLNTGKQEVITSGATNNVEPAICSH